MGIIKEYFAKREIKKHQAETRVSLLKAITDVALPQLSSARKRSSVPDEEYYISVKDKVRVIKPRLPWTFLEAIEVLSITNPDLSQMVANVIMLGNRGHFVEVVTGDKASAANAGSILQEAAKRIYPVSAGVDGLVNALLGQLARSGALSAEVVMSQKLSDGMDRVELVPVRTIRWARSDTTGLLVPYQYVNVSFNQKKNLEPWIPLNELTYTYLLVDSLEGSPYGIPPAAAALTNLTIQLDMVKNLASVIRKLGLVGFLQILVRPPEFKKGETTDQYKTRMEGYLSTAVDTISDNFNDGLFVGFIDQHEVEMQSTTADLRGAESIFQINEEQIFSGLKSDPAMHGRTYSTTETYAGVVYDKLMASLDGYKRLVKRFIERIYRLELLAHGVVVDDVNIIFRPHKHLDALHEHQAEQIKRENALQDLKIGLISWLDYSRKLNYDTPFKDSPDFEALKTGTQLPPDSNKDGDSEKEEKFMAVLDNNYTSLGIHRLSGDDLLCRTKKTIN